MGEKNNEQSGVENKALKAGLWYTISNVATKAILVLTTPFFARIMTKADYGITATFTSWYTLLVTFCTLNLTYSIGRAKIDMSEKLDEYVGSMQIMSLIVSVIISSIAIVFINPIANMLELTPFLVVILAIYLMFAPTTALYQAKFKYQYRYKENILITFYTTLSSVIISFLLVFTIQEEKYTGRILGIVIPAVLLSLGFWIFAAKKGYLKFRKTYVKYGLAISLPLVLNSISLNILAQSDRIVITKNCGTELTAVYTIAYQIAILVSLVLDSIGQAWLPWFHDTFALKEYDSIRKNLKPLIIFGCYVGLGCVAIAPEAIWIMGGSGYAEGKWVIAPIVLGLVCKFIYANYEHIELHLKKTKYIGFGTVVAAILNIILNIIFVPKYGFIAAGYTTFFSYFVLMSVHYFITKIILKVDIYDHKFMYLAILIEFVFAVILLMLYPYVIIRYILIIVMTVIMALYNKNIILSFIKKKKVE